MVTFIVELGTPNKNKLCKIYIIPYLNKSGKDKGKKLQRLSVDHKVFKEDFNNSAKYGKWVRVSNLNYAKINQDIEKEIDKFKSTGEKSNMVFSQATKELIKGFDTVKNEAHITTINTASKSFIKKMGDMAVTDISERTIKEYRATCGVKNSTLINYLSKIKAIVGVVHSTDIFKGLRIKKDPTLRNFLTPAEVEVLKKCPNMTEKQKRAVDFWLLLYYNRGIRGRDLLLLKKPEFITSKNRKKVVLKFSDESLEIIKRWKGGNFLLNYMDGKPTTVKETTKALSNVYIHLQAVCKKAGINKKIGPHTARHSYAWLLIINGVDLYTAANLLTDTPSSTENYLKDFSDEYLQGVNEKLFK